MSIGGPHEVLPSHGMSYVHVIRSRYASDSALNRAG